MYILLIYIKFIIYKCNEQPIDYRLPYKKHLLNLVQAEFSAQFCIQFCLKNFLFDSFHAIVSHAIVLLILVIIFILLKLAKQLSNLLDSLYPANGQFVQLSSPCSVRSACE